MSAADALRKSEQYLDSAEVLLESKDTESAVSRAYYAMFFVARTALRKDGIETKTHSGLVNQFGLHFVKSGLLSEEFGQSLREVQQLRQLAEYAESAGVISTEDARASIDAARSFVERVRRELEA